MLWVFPGFSLNALELMPLPELLEWHSRAVARKQADLTAASAAADRMAATVARILGAR